MSEQSTVAIIVALIGAFAAIIAAFVTILKPKTGITKKHIPFIIIVFVSTILLLGIVKFSYSRITRVSTIDSMDNISDWKVEEFTDEKSDECLGSVTVKLIPGIKDDAIKLTYELKNDGWVLIKKTINPDIFNKTKKIRFHYKGNGASNTIEVKLVYFDGTTFGKVFNHATNTNDEWALKELLFSDFIYFWGESRSKLDLDYVNEFHFAISNKTADGDTAGSGYLVIDDLQTVR